ncbi:MAG TPA: histidine kinase, partial [Gemmatimonadaceae bacterium]|nr:histidine kinase [Gemmatimonadaceae bacterium]
SLTPRSMPNLPLNRDVPVSVGRVAYDHNAEDHLQQRQQVVHRLPDVRTERLIAVARLLLAVCGLFAVTVDPPRLGPNPARASMILLAYTVYAVGVIVVLRLAHERVLRHRLLVHVTDLVVFAFLVFTTGGTASPFVTPAAILIVAATLRWEDVGATRTGIGVLAVFAGTFLYDSAMGLLDINPALVRAAFLVAATLLLAELGRLERAHVQRITRVSRWPYPRATLRAELVGELLPRAAAAVGAPRAVLALEDPEEPWLDVFSWRSGRLSRARVPQSGDEPIVAEIASEAPLLWMRDDGRVIYLSDDRPQLHRGTVVAPWFGSHVEASSTLALPLRGQDLAGHLFLLDASDLTADDLRLGEAIARLVSDSLQHFALAEQLRSMTAAEERVRISRDLHDGVLQTLTGIALKIASVRQLVGSSPESAREQLQELEGLILAEQRDLRFFTTELRLRSGKEADGVLFHQTMAALIDRVQKIWAVDVVWSPEEALGIPPTIAWETYQIVHEAIVNAARHGQATRIELRLDPGPSGLRLSVADNGSGFPFHGHFDMDELRKTRRGPRSLRERVAGLHGSMWIYSSSDGATVEITLPTNGSGA